MANRRTRRAGPSNAERQQRRDAERERARQAAEQLLSSDGWQRWVEARSMFHRYSQHNTLLLALEFALRGTDPEPVAGFHTWKRLGRQVRKGEHGIRIAARITPRRTSDIEPADHREPDENELRAPTRFTTVSVFFLSQTDPIPGAEQLPLAPPHQPLTGDSHAHLLDPLRSLAGELGYTVSLEPIAGNTRGWCDSQQQRIVVDAGQPLNGQVRTLVHELAHALGVTYQTHTRSQAEVIVETTTLIVLAGAGLDTSAETTPYLAGWGEDGDLDAIIEHAELIDRLARTIETAITAPDQPPDAPLPSSTR